MTSFSSSATKLSNVSEEVFILMTNWQLFPFFLWNLLILDKLSFCFHSNCINYFYFFGSVTFPVRNMMCTTATMITHIIFVTTITTAGCVKKKRQCKFFQLKRKNLCSSVKFYTHFCRFKTFVANLCSLKCKSSWAHIAVVKK